MAGAPTSEVGATAETTACKDGIVVEALVWTADATTGVRSFLTVGRSWPTSGCTGAGYVDPFFPQVVIRNNSYLYRPVPGAPPQGIVPVTVNNHGSGTCLPTGSTSSRLMVPLEVVADYGILGDPPGPLTIR